MANFPNSVTVYTTRNPGDTIPSADWDSFGAEISAIEDGLINGTAPIHSSNLTVNTLTASSNVTVGATLLVNGVATITNTLGTSSNVSVGGELFVVKPPPTVLAMSSVNLQVANNVVTAVNFETTEFISTSAMHSTSSTPNRFFPPSSGLYHVIASATWAFFSSLGSRTLYISNSVAAVAQARQTALTGGGTQDMQVEAYVYFQTSTAATDFLQFQVSQDSGSTGSLAASTGIPYSPRFCMVKIR